MHQWHLYLIRTRLGTLYTGIATDVARRYDEHCAGGQTGAKYLRAKGPLAVVYQVPIGSRALALKVEHGLKRLTKTGKEAIVNEQPRAEVLLAMLGIDH